MTSMSQQLLPPAPFAARLDALKPGKITWRIAGSKTAVWTYQSETKPKSAAQTTILAIHGFRGDHHGLEPLVAFLPEANWVVPDLPGFGESPAFAGAHTAQRYDDWLIALVKHAHSQLPKNGRLVLLGHSFGSILVSRVAGSLQELDGLVMVNPIAANALQGPRGVLTRLAVFYYWLAKVLPEGLGRGVLGNRLVVRVMGNIMAKNPDRPVRRYVHGQHFAYFSTFADRGSLLETFQISISHDVAESVATLAKSTLPILLLAGELDDITHLDQQHALAKRMPNAKLHVVPNVGHLVHYETPAAAMSVMGRWLLGLVK